MRSPFLRYSRSVRDREVGGSNPLAPINRINNLGNLRIAFFFFTHHSLTNRIFGLTESMGLP